MGPLQGLEVLVAHLLPASERVRVLLEFLGRSVQMEVSRETLIQPRASAVSPLQSEPTFAQGALELQVSNLAA